MPAMPRLKVSRRTARMAATGQSLTIESTDDRARHRRVDLLSSSLATEVVIATLPTPQISSANATATTRETIILATISPPAAGLQYSFVSVEPLFAKVDTRPRRHSRGHRRRRQRVPTGTRFARFPKNNLWNSRKFIKINKIHRRKSRTKPG